MRVRKIEE
jgi:hypothetical protein